MSVEIKKKASFHRFEDFKRQLCRGMHKLHAEGHTLKVYASNSKPNAISHKVKADIPEISAVNGYQAGGSDIQNNIKETDEDVILTGINVIWMARGGSFGPFRYVILYNSTADGLISWWDYGEPVVVDDAETFKIEFGDKILNIYERQ